jgi:hypothetical protein
MKLDIVFHHGVEAAAFLAVGTYAFSNFTCASLAYGAGKVTYIATRGLLNRHVPQWSIGTHRKIGWAACLLVGGATLHKTRGKSTSILTTAAEILGIVAISIAARTLSNRTYQYLTKGCEI